MRYKLKNKKNAQRTAHSAQRSGFTLIEVLVGIIVFGFVLSAAGGVLYHIQRAWQRQRDDMLYIENARWALEFMTKELRRTRNSDDFQIKGAQKQIIFNIDTDYTILPNPDRKVLYHAPSPWIRRREGNPGLGWGGATGWHFISANLIPPGPSDVFYRNGDLLTIEIRTGNQNTGRSFYFRTKVRMRN